MFLCTHCDEQTDSDPCQECASVFDERGENYPPVLRFQVVPAPAQPEQPRGEGDDLASRLDERAELWERKGGLGANIAAGAYRQAAEIARASTHPEQSARGDLAERLRAEAESKNWWPETRATALLREAASTIDHQTKALEAADDLAAHVGELVSHWGANYSPGDRKDRTIASYNRFRSTRTTKGGRDDG
jgi:hypothetical protein